MIAGNDTATSGELEILDDEAQEGEIEELSGDERTSDLEAEVERTVGPPGETGNVR